MNSHDGLSHVRRHDITLTMADILFVQEVVLENIVYKNQPFYLDLIVFYTHVKLKVLMFYYPANILEIQVPVIT